jgi:hypothetical protein
LAVAALIALAAPPRALADTASGKTYPDFNSIAQSLPPAWTEEAASKVAADYQAAMEKLRIDREQARKELEKAPAYAAPAETAAADTMRGNTETLRGLRPDESRP